MENQQMSTVNGETGMIGTKLTAADAKTILDNIENESPLRWPAAVKTLIVGAFQTIERVESAVANFTAAVAKIGSDLEMLKRDYIPRGEYDKLATSHKRLVPIVISLQTEIGAMRQKTDAPASAPDVEAHIAAAAAAAVESPGEKPPEAAKAAAPGTSADAPLPQEDAEALMDAAITNASGVSSVPFSVDATAAAPTFASPTGGARRRRA